MFSVYCPNCREESYVDRLSYGDMVACDHCGHTFRVRRGMISQPKINVNVNTPEQHGFPAFLSFLLPGLGQLCKGQIIGVLWIFLVTFGYIFFVVPGLVLHILCIVDAYNTPRVSNGSNKIFWYSVSDVAILVVVFLVLFGWSESLRRHSQDDEDRPKPARVEIDNQSLLPVVKREPVSEPPAKVELPRAIKVLDQALAPVSVPDVVPEVVPEPVKETTREPEPVVKAPPRDRERPRQPVRSQEIEAARKLKMVKILIENDRMDGVVDRLQEIIDRFPKTRTALEAKELLSEENRESYRRAKLLKRRE